ncbi:MAG: UvrD-helicase domain-containing protein [Candidatus Levybacteria bacterium]|nr:UvrD-helicase domain-containing protein [Candidatus Levybacteria bacterium]
MQDILNTLNSEQRNAVTTTDGPLIVLAGAGSGKTRVLIHKVLYLMQEKNIKGENILMVTFTNKAASEMKERIKSAMASHLHNSNLPIVGTFHSLCARILRKYGKNVSLSHAFRIYDTEDQLDVIKQAFEILDYSPKDIKPKSALHTISDAKNQMIDPETYASIARGNFQKGVAAIYAVYQKLLQEQDAVDFDDLMLKTIELFKNNLDILSIYQNQFLYILVDEYQDTNPAQYLLTKFLSGKYRNICIVGDFSQSIYSFRGADYKNLERFKIDFPEAKELSLSQNYRSTQPILDAAFSVISHNTSHPVLSLWTNKKVGESIELFLADSEHNEAEFIIQKVLQKRASDTQFNLKDVAVLYRTNAQSRALEETFLHHSIPYVLVGGTRFYSRKEVKDAISFLSFLVNQKDKVAHKRIEKLGKKRLGLFTTYLENFLALKKIDDAPTIDILDEVLSYTNYLKMYDDTDPEDRSRLENIKELRSVAIEFPNIVDFLENIALVEQEYVPETKDKNAEKNAITLMTIHSAKGLEFKMVFLIGMEEGLFPHAQSILESESIEEERRLAYVGITRAKEKLYLTFAKRRLFFGQRVTNSVSRFIFELPQEVLDNNTEIIENGAPPFL